MYSALVPTEGAAAGGLDVIWLVEGDAVTLATERTEPIIVVGVGILASVGTTAGAAVGVMDGVLTAHPSKISSAATAGARSQRVRRLVLSFTVAYLISSTASR